VTQKCTQKIGILPGQTKKWRIKRIDELNEDELDELYCTVRPRFLPYHAYPTYYSIVQQWAKQHYYARGRNKPTIITELQLNLQKHINICCCSFNKAIDEEKKLCCKKIWQNDKFDLITWDSRMVWAWNSVCGRFINFQNGRKILILLTFGCPTENICSVCQVRTSSAFPTFRK